MSHIFSNRKNKRKFTEILTDMVCYKQFDLQHALELMKQQSGKNKQITSAAASAIYEHMLSGETYSDALKLCSEIDFDTVYISFIRFAQRCGCLEKTLEFLNARCIREEENISRIIQVSAYPLFVILTAVFSGLFLYFYADSSISDSLIFQNIQLGTDFYYGIILSFGFLIVFSTSVFLFLKKTLGINRLYEAFLTMGFLIKGGESLANAVNDAVNILGYDSKEGRLFAQAGRNLSYGAGLKDAFALNSWSTTVRSELEEAFFYAEKSGGENDVFEKIALWLNSRDEKRRNLCLKLIEPFFILGTGIFLMIFLFNLAIPFFSELSVFF